MPTYIDDLDRIISSWPEVSRRVTEDQINYSRNEVNFCWLSPGNGMVQLIPCLGPRSVTRRLERDGNLVKVIRQKTGTVEALYEDPERILIVRWSYPGFNRTSQEAALKLIRQSYDQSGAQMKTASREAALKLIRQAYDLSGNQVKMALQRRLSREQ